eukprot:TRINITY_DN2598_c0_g1_i2.p1 TRINITY_DN2598_c0_g1~~TRINITY_DN2598_c0_g1_i2.p1  ORF type:complete len:352 (-),score=97.17 TRINITY_DN2598_c0_g1_i2:143-1198(-)
MLEEEEVQEPEPSAAEPAPCPGEIKDMFRESPIDRSTCPTALTIQLMSQSHSMMAVPPPPEDAVLWTEQEIEAYFTSDGRQLPDNLKTAAQLKRQGDVAATNKEEKLAEMYYGFALEAGSDELHQVYGNRSLVRARRRRFEWALQDAERCIYLKPDWPKGHLRAAVAFEGLKEWTTALEKFQQASKLCHDQAEARTEFGMMNAWESKISKRCSEGVKLCHDKIEYESRPYILTNELGEEVFEEQGDPFIGYRVHYHKNGAAERLWVQWEFYRWSQTSTTITILLFAIPPDELVAREIEATFKAKFLAVKHKRTGKTWFERELFDLVMPDECTWTLEAVSYTHLTLPTKRIV